VLGEGFAAVLAVDLRGRGEEQAPAEPIGALGDDLGAAHAAAQRFDRAFDDQLDADGRGEMEAGVGPLHALVHQLRVADGPFDHLRLAGGHRVDHILEAAGAEVIEDEDAVAARDEGVGQVRTDEARPAGDQVSQPMSLHVPATAE
jgi:hypothetical protein